jgi:Acyl-CoA carboxylase epsilon subunit
VSDVGDETGEPQGAAPEHEAHEPHIRVLKGEPTAEELAALIAVLGSAVGGGGEPGPPDHSRWGLPVDKLRYPVFSWQKITLLERTHMRR